MADESSVTSQSKKVELKEVIEFVDKNKFFTYEEYLRNRASYYNGEENSSGVKDFTATAVQMRSPPKQVIPSDDRRGNADGLRKLPATIEPYGRFDYFYGENQDEIKEVVVQYDAPQGNDGRMKNLPVIKSSTIAYGSYEFLYQESQGAIKSIPLYPSILKNESVDPVYENIGGDYYATDKGYYYLNKNKIYVQMTDFKICVIERRITYNVNGTQDDEIQFMIFDDSGWECKTTIEYDKWSTHLIGWIRARAPTRILNLTEFSISYFEQLMTYVLKNSKFPTKYFVSHWGWGAWDPNSGRKFWHGGLEGCKSSKILTPHMDEQKRRIIILREALNFTEIGPRANVLLVYSCASYTDAIYTDAGHFLSHCIMVIGSSGMLKTATVRELFNVFTKYQDRITSVRSTEASLHVMTEKAYDDTLVIDDFNREGSKYEIAQKTKNIQTLVRSYSEKVSRSKYGGNDNVKQYAIRGGLVITGETNMTGELKSGKLRYLKLVIAEKFNGELLKKYQKNPTIMPFFFSEYIRFLQANYLGLMDFVIKRFDAYREQFCELREPRIIDAGVHLKMTTQIMLEWLKSTEVLTAQECNLWLDNFERILFELLQSQSKEVQTEDPCILYVKQIFELLNAGTIELAPNVEAYKLERKKYIGYVDGDLLMFEKDNLYREVVNACRAKDEYLTMSSDEVLKVLKEKGISACNTGSNLRKASSKLSDPKKGISRPLMLALRRYVCEQILESEN